MEKESKETKKGISIKKLNYFMAAVTLIVSGVLLFVSYRTNSAYYDVRVKTEAYMEGQKCSQDLQEASDYLTEQVRCFVVTGERSFLDAYFKESNETRRRENALNTLKATFEGTEEYEALERAAHQSNTLMETEYHAMRLTVDAYGYDLADYPDAVKNWNLTDEEKAMSSEQKKEKAISLVFDDNYHSQKDIISSKTQECLDKISKGIKQQQDSTEKRFRTIIGVEQGLIFALIATVLIIVVLTTIQVIAPLIRAIPHIRDDKPIPINGAEEFRFLANTYNKIYEENKNQKQELEYEASHDQLTGVYNRKGFEMIINDIDKTKTALLLIDVDRFKQINDTYGHTTGDKVLSHLTSIISSSFRSTDILCRIGGDEFVLFMPDVGEEARDMIDQKIKKINDEMVKGDDELPKSTISVGVAFGDHEDGTQLYKRADTALYSVKNNGRCGCAFA